jgi:hypothetical protein
MTLVNITYLFIMKFQKDLRKSLIFQSEGHINSSGLKRAVNCHYRRFHGNISKIETGMEKQ